MAEVSMSQQKIWRGVNWSYVEIADLIAIWRQPSVLEQLEQSHRNIETYNEVAEAMRAKGHQRTGEECRRKCKGLKEKYHKVRKHNLRSGQNASTMPFYKELHAFLCRDCSIRPSRVGTSAEIVQFPGSKPAKAKVGEASPQEDGSQELFKATPDQEAPNCTARMTSVACLAEIQGKRVRQSAEVTLNSAMDRLMEQNSEHMRGLLAHLEREVEFQKVVDERSLQQQECLSATLEAQTALLATLVEAMKSAQGGMGVVGQGTERRDIPAVQEQGATVEVDTQDPPPKESVRLRSRLVVAEPPSQPQVRRRSSRRRRAARGGRRPSTHPQ